MRIKRLITCILFIQALFLCSLVSAAQKTTTLSNYKFSEFVSNPEGEFDSIDFNGAPYFVEIISEDNKFDLVTTTLDSKYKLIKSTVSLTDLLNLTTENVDDYELQVKANAKQIFLIIQGNKHDGSRFGYLLNSTDGKSWQLNQSFPMNGIFTKNNSDDIWINDAINNSIVVTYSSYDLRNNEIAYFSHDNGVTWNNFEVPQSTYIAGGPFIVNNLLFLHLNSVNSSVHKSGLYYTDGKSELVESDMSQLKGYRFNKTKAAKYFEYIDSIQVINNKLVAQVEYINNNDENDYSNLLWVSNDNGKTWSVLAELPESNIYQVKFVNNAYHIITFDNKFNSFYYRLSESELSKSSDHSMAKPTLKFDKAMSGIMNITAKEVVFLLANMDGVSVVKF